MIIRRSAGAMPFGHTASTVASMSRHLVVAVPRGWRSQADDRRPTAVAIDGKHSSSSTLGVRLLLFPSDTSAQLLRIRCQKDLVHQPING
jgi:hypothetical protein